MYKLFSFAVLITLCNSLSAQTFMTRQGQISFTSKTPLENINAVNNEVATALDLQNGDIAFAVLIRSFHFEKALMEEHFNENYMESDKMPKATFKGKIGNPSSIDLSKDGSYEMVAEGDMTIHGVTQKIKVPGTVVVKGGLPQVIARFKLAPKDYNIKIPSLVADKIEESMAVSVNCRYEKK